MDRRIILKAAMEAWGRQKVAEGNLGEHIPPAELYELLLRPSVNGENGNTLGHLTRCPICLRELKEIAQSMEEVAYWDCGRRKAAASELQWPQKIPTDGGKYVIEIRRYLAREDSGVITLKVEERYRDALEGKTMRVTDGTGRQLLEAEISGGEVSQVVEGLQSIVPQFLVRPA